MFDLLREAVGWTVPVFVVATMLNVGLTQRPSAVLVYLKDWRFVLRMALANFVLVPLLAFSILHWAPFALPLKIGIFLFSLCAGAPFLIKLTQTANHDLALGAATMMLLVVLTLVYVPIVLPMIMSEANVQSWAIARTLLLQMALPLVAGMALARLLPRPAAGVQPWVARIANIALWVVLGATLVGYSPDIRQIVGTGALLASVAVVLGAFGIGYALGGRDDHLRDIGGLGTAQRNTAAAVLIAAQNFDDPRVLVVVTIANTLGLVILLLIAKRISRDNVRALAEA